MIQRIFKKLQLIVPLFPELVDLFYFRIKLLNLLWQKYIAYSNEYCVKYL
jgi:hypothetical protein